MGLEIERKFKVIGDLPKHFSECVIRQGYLVNEPGRTVRIRVSEHDHDYKLGFITVKIGTDWKTLKEYEYEIDEDEAEELLAQCKGDIISKSRKTLFSLNKDDRSAWRWEVDTFLSGPRTGEVIAEIELNSHDDEFDIPEWIGEEVTGNPEYLNSAMAKEKTMLYLACHTYCIYESASYTISTHRTREGAEAALEKHKAERYGEHTETYKSILEMNLAEGIEEEDAEAYYSPDKAMGFERWTIVEQELFD